MRVRTADENGVLHPRHDHVVRVAARTHDEALVFLARDACADAFNPHSLYPPNGLSGKDLARSPGDPVREAGAGEMAGRGKLRSRATSCCSFLS